MNTDFFATLLHCNDCAHAVDLHGPSGCTRAACVCRHTRDGVIEKSVGDAIIEANEKYAAVSRTLRDAAEAKQRP